LEVKTEEGTYTCSLFFNSELILSIEYIHSVSLTKVIDKFKISKEGIWAIESRWQQFDAGQSTDFTKVEGNFFVKEMNLFLGKKWCYWFIPLNRVNVKLGQKEIFNNIEKEGKVLFEVKKKPVVFILFD